MIELKVGRYSHPFCSITYTLLEADGKMPYTSPEGATVDNYQIRHILLSPKLSVREGSELLYDLSLLDTLPTRERPLPPVYNVLGDSKAEYLCLIPKSADLETLPKAELAAGESISVDIDSITVVIGDSYEVNGVAYSGTMTFISEKNPAEITAIEPLAYLVTFIIPYNIQ